VQPARRNVAGDMTYAIFEISLCAEMLQASRQVMVARHTRK